MNNEKCNNWFTNIILPPISTLPCSLSCTHIHFFFLPPTSSITSYSTARCGLPLWLQLPHWLLLMALSLLIRYLLSPCSVCWASMPFFYEEDMKFPFELVLPPLFFILPVLAEPHPSTLISTPRVTECSFFAFYLESIFDLNCSISVHVGNHGDHSQLSHRR